MDSQPPPLIAFRQFVWILYFSLVSATGLYWLVPYYVSLEHEAVDVGLIKPVFQAVAALAATAALYVRFSLIGSLLEPKTPPALPHLEQRLRTHYIICYTLCESVGLFGLVLYLLGGTRQDFAVLYFAALGLFLLCYPRLPDNWDTPAKRGGELTRPCLLV